MSRLPGIRRLSVAIVPLIVAGCGDSPSQLRVADPIPGIPENTQRTIARTEFPRQWPFAVGTGTLGSLDEGVVFRVDGTTYALNDAAAARGFARVEPIRLTQHRTPSNPLVRLTQNRRMQIFSESSACVDSAPCKQRIRALHAISDAELKQVEAEGDERRWPPLSPERVSLSPIIDAGLKLCRR